MKEKSNVFIKAIFAGVLIGIAGGVYLSLYEPAKIIGALLFSFALLFVVAYELNLYTGKIGYFFDRKPNYLIDILLMIFGNFIGVITIAFLIRLSGLEVIIDEALVFSTLKESKSWSEVFGQALLCGVLMHLAVDGFKLIKTDGLKLVIVIMAVMIFLLSGYEHSIANIFYFTVSWSWSGKVILYFLIMLIGNGLGAIAINFLSKSISKNSK